MSTTKDQIQLADINEELNHLWDLEQGKNKTRASLFTFILYVQKNERLSFSERLIKSVVSKFPCRVIFIISDSSQENYLHTSVHSETIGEGELQIFCEIIRIEVAGSLHQRVSFITIPHILPDLPVYLLWTQDPATESRILPHLESVANRIIFDPESTHNLQNYARSVSTLLHTFQCEIGDLNWSATLGWRTLLTQIFDTQDSLAHLTHSKIIRLYYNKDPSSSQHTEIQAAYLQAWLASRLNWVFQSIEREEGNIRLTYTRLAKEVVILLIPQEIPDLTPGTLIQIELECEKNKVHYIFKRHPKTRQVFVQYFDKNRCDIPFCHSLLGFKEGQEIVEEIFHPSTGSHYRDMLSILTLIPWTR